jgi:hypothetical protein
MPTESRCQSSEVNIPLAVNIVQFNQINEVNIQSSSIKSMNKFTGAVSSHPGMNTWAYTIIMLIFD